MEADYIALTLAFKKETQLRFLLTEFGFLYFFDQYVEIMIIKRNSRAEKIMANF